MQGIPFGEHGEQLLFQLFANDTNLVLEASKAKFRTALEVIEVFEIILGARLNLEKSTILHLDEGSQPGWFSNLVVKLHVFELSWLPYGVRIYPTKEVEFLLDKVRKQVFHWSNRMLSM